MSSPRRAPPGFPVDVDGMMETSNTGIAAIRKQLANQRKEMREEKGRCGNPSCNKEEGNKTSLRACSRCQYAFLRLPDHSLLKANLVIAPYGIALQTVNVNTGRRIGRHASPL